MNISIVIPTFENVEFKKSSLNLTLLSISNQNFIKNIEVIIIENSDNSNLVGQIKIPRNISVIFLNNDKKGTIAKSRNLGVKYSSYENILFLDDDTLLTTNSFLKSGLDILKENNFICGFKRYWTYIDWSYSQIFKKLCDDRFLDFVESNFVLPIGFNRDSGYLSLLDVSFIANCGFIRKRLFNSINGFDETYEGWGREDCDLMYRLLFFANSKFVNGYNIGSVLHLNHPVKNHNLEIERNEKKYIEMERKNGKHLIFSHLFGKTELKNSSWYIDSRAR